MAFLLIVSLFVDYVLMKSYNLVNPHILEDQLPKASSFLLFILVFYLACTANYLIKSKALVDLSNDTNVWS